MTLTEQLGALNAIPAQGSIHILFQPIVSLTEGRLLGYEVLSRGRPISPYTLPRTCLPWSSRPNTV
jgi:EAL domain-containing protein (putative c-di-GMP-specific phosphodiesterase class I)